MQIDYQKISEQEKTKLHEIFVSRVIKNYLELKT